MIQLPNQFLKKMKGLLGQDLAVMKKNGAGTRQGRQPVSDYIKDKAVFKELEKSLGELLNNPQCLLARKEYILFGDQLYLLPPEMINYKGMKIIRPGLHMGTMKKNRFEPSHALALSLRKEEVNQWVDLP